MKRNKILSVIIKFIVETPKEDFPRFILFLSFMFVCVFVYIKYIINNINFSNFLHSFYILNVHINIIILQQIHFI